MGMVLYMWLFKPRYVEQAVAHHCSQLDLREMMRCAPLLSPAIHLPPGFCERPISHAFEHLWWKEHGSDPSISFKY
jgi:hypothetical protein